MDWATLGSGAIGGISSALGASSANKSAKRAAAEQMRFQLTVLQNQHKWEVEDLRNAGLNPRLSAMGGSGTGGAAGASYVPQNELAGADDAVNTGLAAKKNAEEVKNLQESNKQIASQTELNKAAEIAQKADAVLKSNSAKNVAVQNKLLNNELPKSDAIKETNNSIAGKRAIAIGEIMRNFNPFLSGANSAKSLLGK